MLDAGCMMPDAGCRMLDAGCMDAVCRMCESGVGFRMSEVDFGGKIDQFILINISNPKYSSK